MAKANVSTCAGAINRVYSPTTILRFAVFNASLRDLLDTERAQLVCDRSAPGVDAAISNAERARDITLKRLNAFRSCPESAVPSPLSSVAMLFEIALQSKCPDEVMKLRTLAGLCRRGVSVPRTDAVGRRVAHMMLEALSALEAYLALEEADTNTPKAPHAYAETEMAAAPAA